MKIAKRRPSPEEKRIIDRSLQDLIASITKAPVSQTSKQ